MHATYRKGACSTPSPSSCRMASPCPINQTAVAGHLPTGPTTRSKGCLSNKTALAMAFKLVEGAQKNCRRIDGHNQLPKLIQGVRFTDGIEVIGNSTADVESNR